jgi:hypothetical protein
MKLDVAEGWKVPKAIAIFRLVVMKTPVRQILTQINRLE